MIGKLSGRIDSTGEDWVLLDVGGVGYIVFCSAQTLAKLGQSGDPASLLIETHVREDHIHLFGFAEGREQEWFRLLCTVQGVGARMALSILSAFPTAELANCIAAQDKAALTRANGVGPKIAGRIASELKDKAGAIALGTVVTLPRGGARPGAAQPSPSDEAVSALVNLGYGRSEAFQAVNRAAGELGDGASLEAMIRAGLKELAS